MTVLQLKPKRGGFLRPFGCGWFIKELLLGNAPHGSERIDPSAGAYQALIFKNYKEALIRATALDKAIRTEEKRARKGKRVISPDNIDKLFRQYLAMMPYKAHGARYHSFVTYFSDIQKLTLVLILCRWGLRMAEIEMMIESIRRGTVSNEYSLILKEKAAERYLPIYIGNSAASKIKELLIGAPVSGPSKPSLADNISEDVELAAVVINKFKDNDFYARLRLRRVDKTRNFCVPLTEAIIASTIKEAPILIDESVLAKAGVTV
jgi:bifunctional DNase/RNase